MAVALTASALRQNVYRLLDGVLETGVPLEIERHGRRLRIIAIDAPRRTDRLIARPDAIIGDPDELVEMDW
ncbi:MAG: type II toxin-antitoxin system Phd/YefM family antitoxin, partial [Chloroflexi bacterium]|nr:type II toxin-antitoxin system Phd/YefM family antitoxin [Chloroflexota bacterium]